MRMDRCPYLGLAHTSRAMREHETAMYILNSNVVMAFQTSWGASFVSSVLALITTVMAPATATTTPQKSRWRNTSLKKMGAMTQFETSATTPSGDTIDAGAKP